MSDLEMNGNLIQFKGELNEELVKDLKDLILAKQDFPEKVILDLTELESIGVMGIQIILAVRENLMKNKSGLKLKMKEEMEPMLAWMRSAPRFGKPFSPFRSKINAFRSFILVRFQKFWDAFGEH